jgi:hypothetical protein
MVRRATAHDGLQSRRRGGCGIPAYAIYGLTLASNAELPRLVEAQASAVPDMTLTVGAAPQWWRANRAPSVRYRTPPAELRPDDHLVVHECAEGFRFRYADATEFHLSRDGREIWATWDPASTLADMATYLLGPVLGFAQRLRGVLCLHASAVVVDDFAVALCGPAEAGKSTTAGAFAAAGYGVLADDVTSLREHGAELMVMPAFGHLRVWEASERILLGTSGTLPRLTPTWEKRLLGLRERGWTFQAAPVRLGAIVLLAPRADDARAPRVETVPPGEAFVAIAANSYTQYLLDAAMRAAEFASIAHMMATAVVLRATPHTDPERLGALVAMIAGAVRA